MHSLTHALQYLCCAQGCTPSLTATSDALVCAHCGARYPIRDGVIDFVPEQVPNPSRSQRVMENPFIARIYEDYWRPWFTSLGSDLGCEEETAWLLRQDSRVDLPCVLDLACGTGRYARVLATARRAGLVFGVDLSLPMLKEAVRRTLREGHHNIVFVRAQAEYLPLRAGSIDALNCFGALHLFPSPENALSELARVAKSQAVFTCLTAGQLEDPVGARAQDLFSRLAYFRFFTVAELEHALAHSGFSAFTSESHQAVLLVRAQKT